MSFQSYLFLLVFLPLVLAAIAIGRRIAPVLVKPFLIAASLVFLASWQPAGVPIFLASVAANRLAVECLHRARDPAIRRAVLTIAIAANLGLLIWFRYLSAWLADLDTVFTTGLTLPDFAVPLGISFFTFTQIGLLLDTHAGIEPRRPLADQVLFVACFPALIAGPVLTAREVMPQLATLGHVRPGFDDWARGGGIFLIGLLKKTLLADPLAPMVAAGHADPAALTLFDAWHVALGYYLQLYFDFSGYSDMAVGLARMLGLHYPWNFNSPYQARSVIAYWQRWHISLTRFFMTTLHAPMAMAILRWRRARGWGVDRAAQRRPVGFLMMHAAPLLLTMALAGIWHGPSLTFLVFGLMHAAFLAVNHGWRLYRAGASPSSPGGSSLVDRVGARGRAAASIGLTCLCVLVGSVVFRADTVGSALDLLAGMAGLHGVDPIVLTPRAMAGMSTLGLLLAVVWFAPNTRAIMEDGAVWSWRPTIPWAVACGIVGTVGLLSAGGNAEFLYARF